MSFKKVSKEIEKKIKEIDDRIAELKKYVDKNIDVNEFGIHLHVLELSKIRDEIKRNYDNYKYVANKSEVDLPKFEKNIYNSIESFNQAFTKAGSMFKIH